jgi:O-antigen/teichoic acid export membrane protein
VTELRRSVREGSLVVVGQALAVVGMLFTVRILTEIMPPSVYGEFALALTLTTFLGQTVFGPLAGGALRFYAPAVEKRSLGSYLAASWRLSRSAILLVAAILVVACVVLASIGHPMWSSLAIGAAVITTSTGLASIMSGIQNAARNRGVVAFHQTIDPWLKLGVTFALLVQFGTSSVIAMLGYAIATTIVLVSQHYFYRRLTVDATSTRDGVAHWNREIWQYMWPFSLWGIFTWAQLSSDRWAIDWFASRADVGYFGVLGQFGYSPIQIITAIAIQYVAPILFERAGDGADPRRTNDVARMSRVLTTIVFAVTAVAVLFALLLHRQLFAIFVASEYASVSYLLPWVILSGGIFAASQSVTLRLMSQLRVREMLAAKITTAILGVLLNILGAWTFGIRGVVMASIAFSTLSLVWMLWLARIHGTITRS